MDRLTRLAGRAVDYIDCQECVLDYSTLAEAVRALPQLLRVQVDNLGLMKNHRAILHGIHVRKDQQPQQGTLRVALTPRGVWFHSDDDMWGLKAGRKIDREQAHMRDIVKQSKQHKFAGKVEVIILDDSM